MKTITKTIIQFNSIAELYQATKESQLTGQEIVNGRAYINGSWQDFEIEQGAKVELMKMISDTLGGQKKTKERILNNLLWGRPQHWGLNRVFFREYNEKILCSYCAGQDYNWELNQIRKSIS